MSLALMNNMKYKIVNEYSVLVKVENTKEGYQNYNGLLMKKDDNELLTAEVIATPDGMAGIKPGDKVLIKTLGTCLEENLFYIHIDSILLKIEK